MAETPEQHEKTEEPTQKKLDDALKKGDVAKSQEVNSWFMMVAATLMIMIFSGDIASSLAGLLKSFLGQAHDMPATGSSLRELFRMLSISILAILGPADDLAVRCRTGGEPRSAQTADLA